MAYAGLDVGTSSCKIVVYDKEGTILYKASRKYTEFGTDGKRELDPSLVIEQVMDLLSEVGKDCQYAIDAMAITSIGESIVCLDENMNSLAYSMVTGDQRGINEIKEIKSLISSQEVFNITGLPPSEMYGLPKYKWLNENTEAIKHAKYILLYEDFIGFMLSGVRKVSYSSASRTMAFDIHKKSWSQKLLDMAGINSEKLSKPVKSGDLLGKLTAENAKKLNLNPDMMIVAGGHDQNCAALGSGLNKPNIGECGMGTCEFMFLMMPESYDQEYMIEHDLTDIPYIFDETFLTSLEITTCGILKNWVRDTFFSKKLVELEELGQDFYKDYIDQAITGIKTDIFVLPQFGSSGNPDINYNVGGTISGLTVHTSPEEIYLAVLESFSFQMLYAYEKAEQIGIKIDRLVATGGGAASDITLQIRADVFDIEVVTIEGDESGTLGCMILASTAAGAYKNIDEAVNHVVRKNKVFKPNRDKHDYYMKKYEKFKELYDKMHLF